MNKFINILIILGGILTVAAFCAVVLIILAINGGADGLWRNMKPNVDPNNSKVVIARNTTVTDINNSFSEINKLGYLKEYTTSFYDRCHRGESNWKRTDGYASQCAYKITSYYGFNGDFKQTILNFEKDINKLGWTATYTDRDGNQPMQYLADVYDKSYGTKRLNGTGVYDVSNLPSSVARYSKNDQTIQIEFVEKSTTDFGDIEYAQRETSGIAGTTYEKQNLPSLPELLKNITNENRYGIVIAITKKYFEN